MNKIPSPLPHEYMCEQYPEIVAIHEERDRQAEYGLNWFEFINTEREELVWGTPKWWDSQPPPYKIEKIKEKISKLKSDLEY